MRGVWTRRRLLLTTAVFLSAVLPDPAGAGESTPDPAALPEAEAPFGLGGVDLPIDRHGVLDLFAALPAAVGGYHQQRVEQASDRIVAPYGETDPILGNPLRLIALHFADGDFFPTDFTAGQYVAMACATDDVEAVACGRDGDLAWLETETTVGSSGDSAGTTATSLTLFTLAWGAIDGAWMFSAAATTPDELEALVGAFVTAAKTPVATPASG